uniref:Uncharacterized protein n=1 Tax=Sphaerodactylus townsendi TaxID=933632 RepID=A0ACB8G2Z1_9SAUR
MAKFNSINKARKDCNNTEAEISMAEMDDNFQILENNLKISYLALPTAEQEDIIRRMETLKQELTLCRKQVPKEHKKREEDENLLINLSTKSQTKTKAEEGNSHTPRGGHQTTQGQKEEIRCEMELDPPALRNLIREKEKGKSWKQEIMELEYGNIKSKKALRYIDENKGTGSDYEEKKTQKGKQPKNNGCIFTDKTGLLNLIMSDTSQEQISVQAETQKGKIELIQDEHNTYTSTAKPRNELSTK